MIPDRSTFENIYNGQPPWDIGRPQKSFIDVADQITGSVLDAGCGTGENALFFASRGQKVTGIDFLDWPIFNAIRKAAERGVTATFLIMDALALVDWSERFDNVIDSGLFHVFNDEDRRRYVEGLANILKPGRWLFLLCFSDDEPGEQGPRRITKQELHPAFTEGWNIESDEPTRAECRPSWRSCAYCVREKWPLGKRLSILKILVNLVSILAIFRAKTWILEKSLQDVKPLRRSGFGGMTGKIS
jgi:SAM-dependent methyltransferase